MAIEIIEMGKHPDERKYEAACRGCGTKLRWQKADAKYDHSGDQRDGPFTQIECPTCGRMVTGY